MRRCALHWHVAYNIVDPSERDQRHVAVVTGILLTHSKKCGELTQKDIREGQSDSRRRGLPVTCHRCRSSSAPRYAWVTKKRCTVTHATSTPSVSTAVVLPIPDYRKSQYLERFLGFESLALAKGGQMTSSPSISCLHLLVASPFSPCPICAVDLHPHCSDSNSRYLLVPSHVGK